MSKTPHPPDHHHHDDPHDWQSSEYVSKWAEGQDQKEANRQEAFRLMAETIPYDKQLPIKILDLGAGYGALTQFLLGYFPNATVICQDGSEEMMKLGHQRMASYHGRFSYVVCNFGKSGWSQKIPGAFEAVVSSIAIHNVGSPNIIRGIYGEIFPLVQSGGCFLNYELMISPLQDHMKWVRQAGFQAVGVIWQDQRRALFGGFKR
ncbi:MAG: class I SAM-dependent methyltransferase [Candidatus Binatia bacterium]